MQQTTESNPVGKQAQRSDATKRKILEAAEQAFATLGLYGARIDDIAQSAGVNKRMIYEYFGNKEELYKTVLELVYLRLGECEADIVALSNEMDAEKAIGSLVEAYFKFLQKNPSYVKMVMWENLMEARYFDEKGLSGIRSPIRRAIQDIVHHGQEQGEFRDGIDVNQVLMTLFACTYNYFSNIHTMTRVMSTDYLSREEIDKRTQSITEMLLGYMRRRGE